MEIMLTSTLAHPITLCYRVGREFSGKENNPILEVELPPRALNTKVSFINDTYYHCFKLQNESYFTSGRIIEGKATEKQAVALHKENSEKTQKKIRDKVTKSTETIQELSNEKVNFSVEKDN